MADAFAADTDVAELYGEIDTEDISKVGALLRRASTMIRAQAYQVDVRIAEDLLDLQTVKDVCVDMVIRVLRNQEGVKQETVGPIATVYDPTVAAGRLFLTPDELFLLQPPSAARATVGTIHTTPALSPRHDRHLRREADEGRRRRPL